MKVHVLQHVPFEGLGSIESCLAARGAVVSRTRFYESAVLPSLAEMDLIIALGGPMSANDEQTFPWLAEEKRFIADALRANLPVLGICLGAQLIASALGAWVYPNAQKEIGWFDIEAARYSPALFRFPKRTTVFHWHGETFDLPPGAVRLARSKVCENQAFQIGGRGMGFQFHLETTPESADAIISNCRHELQESAFVQSETALRKAPADSYARINALMDDALDFLTRAC